MKNGQGGVKLSFVVISVLALGVSAWFNQAQAAEAQTCTYSLQQR
ncbi:MULTISPECIES: hypothetical protein [Pseudoalteromonas]|uniref:Uncharacterized protein n=1 Tax=Pseudoalteromonas luteoviolacea (strain 2ta16) TaxID=1353533 RepID=V4HX38_PSEL2|nr:MULTISPECIES: hypothetical protein [Pseudoalteromonas]ESP95375.1 hypothetical protein PL2TA16_02118 [Pseudoalteromonas luteoviolacea 2ta16]KZN31229.1 hypothetical protein N483_05265 [Pseudoalteromonas luteoviolacea NCIMB 1944]